jgi:hypothetical protein
MTALKDSQAIRSILDYMEDSQPRALVALAQSGQIKTYLTSLADRVQSLAAKLTKEPHPMFKGRELGMEEAEMEALQRILTSEEEDPETKDLEAASKVAKRIREILDSES